MIEWLERKAVREGYPGHPEYLRKYHTPRSRIVWLIVYGLTGLVPFNVDRIWKAPGPTLWTVWLSVGNRLSREIGTRRK